MSGIKITIMVLMLTVLSGCALFMPYKETFSCNIPAGKGYCGSLSDGYEYSIAIENNK